MCCSIGFSCTVKEILVLYFLLCYYSFAPSASGLIVSKRIDFSFVLLSMKPQKQLFSRETLILIWRKFQKVWELVFLSLKSIRVLSLTSRGVDSEMNAFKNPSAKRRFFLLLLPGIFLSILSSNSFNKFLLNVIQHRHIFNWNFQNARSMCWLSVYIYIQSSQYGYIIPKV